MLEMDVAEKISEKEVKAVIEKRLFNLAELSAYLSMPKATIYTWVCLGRIPAGCVVRLGRSLRFEKAGVDEWVNQQKAS